MSLTWEGRELQRADLAVNVYVNYAYNSDGIRTSKSYTNAISGETRNHTYVLDGTRILSEKVTGSLSYTLYYLYDESGNVQGFIYNNAYYYYQKNLQGDVVRILNSSGSVVVEYTYDAWGKILTTTGSLASTVGRYNPFRYRSYYYDIEMGFYYLQSRYYDPTVGRFLNADGIVGANGGIEGYNMFAYCNNNPVMYVDSYGFSAEAAEAAKEALGWCTAASPMALADGPLPVGDALVVLLGIAVFCVEYGRTEHVNITISPFTDYTVNTNTANVEPIPVPSLSNYLTQPSETATSSLDINILTQEYIGKYENIIVNGNVVFSKGHQGNIKDTGLIGVSDKELAQLLKDPNISAKDKLRYRREQKGRKIRNRRKRMETIHKK